MATDPLGAHHRSHAWVVVSVALLVVAALSTRLPSRQFALAAGVLAGGLLGNLVSAVTHGGAVENPFVAGDVAFNLADVLVLGGLVLVALAAMRLAVDAATDAREPTAWTHVQLGKLYFNHGRYAAAEHEYRIASLGISISWYNWARLCSVSARSLV